MASSSYARPITMIVCTVSFVDMEDGSFIMELETRAPLAIGAQGKSGGFIMPAGCILFTPVDTATALRAREWLEGTPGYPAPGKQPLRPWVAESQPGEYEQEEIPF